MYNLLYIINLYAYIHHILFFIIIVKEFLTFDLIYHQIFHLLIRLLICFLFHLIIPSFNNLVNMMKLSNFISCQLSTTRGKLMTNLIRSDLIKPSTPLVGSVTSFLLRKKKKNQQRTLTVTSLNISHNEANNCT